MTTAYPLAWPFGWPRTAPGQRAAARFGTQSRVGRQSAMTVSNARERLATELDRLGARDTILSSNLSVRIDGQPRSGQPEPADTGAAIYFKRRGKSYALACDKWSTVADNIAALAKHIDAMRGMERWGVGSVDQAFAGYAALPSASTPQPWRAVLGMHCADLASAEAAYRTRAREAHPDSGGSHDRMAALNVAIEDARKEFRS